MNGKTCPHCEDGREDGAIESSRHWLTCTAYSELRAGLDPELNVDHRIVFLRKFQLNRIQLEKELIYLYTPLRGLVREVVSHLHCLNVLSDKLILRWPPAGWISQAADYF